MFLLMKGVINCFQPIILLIDVRAGHQCVSTVTASVFVLLRRGEQTGEGFFVGVAFMTKTEQTQ